MVKAKHDILGRKFKNNINNISVKVKSVSWTPYVLHVLFISAYELILSKSLFENKRKSIRTHKTAPLSLFSPIKLATHSSVKNKVRLGDNEYIANNF